MADDNGMHMGAGGEHPLDIGAAYPRRLHLHKGLPCPYFRLSGIFIP